MKLYLPGLSADLFIHDFDPKTAPDESWLSFFALSETIFREFNPGSRLPDREVTRRRLLATNPLYTVKRNLVFDGGRNTVAFTHIAYDTELSPSYEHDCHIGQIHIRVVANWRRKRVATALLNRLLDSAQELNKDTIQIEADNTAGKAFCRSLKGEMVHKEVQHRLYMEEANQQTAAEWLSAGRKKFPDTQFVLFRDCPDDIIDAFCRTYTEIINQRPTGEMEQTIVTLPESRRIEEQNMKKRGIEWYTLISRENNGEISGLTDIMFHPREPHKLVQYFTGVSARHRRKRLAKRLKAEMLVVIKEHFPDVEYITTTMAPDNRPMQSINAQLGFKSRKSTHMYQWALPDLRYQVNERLRKPFRIRKTDGQRDCHG